MKQLDVTAYANSVNQKKQQTRATKRKAVADPVSVEDQLLAEQLAHKQSNRTHKRKLNKMAGQIKRLRKENRDIKQENRRLRQTIEKLKQGKHDIELEGEVQQDVEAVFNECRKSNILHDNLKKQDDSGTLQAFWQEQEERTKCDIKRKKWNPVVLRFMLHLWEKMGEKNFRVLGTEKVSFVCVCVCVGINRHACAGFTFTAQEDAHPAATEASGVGHV